MKHARLRVSGLIAACLLVYGTAAWAQPDTAVRTEKADAEKTTTTEYKQVTVETTQRIERQVIIKEKPKPKASYTVALFVLNRAVERVPDKKVENMADYFTAHCTGPFRIIERETALNAVSNFAMEGPNRGDPQIRRDEPIGTKLDRILSDNTSALRLTENLGADYVMVVSIVNYGTNTRELNDPATGVHVVTKIHQMKTTCKLLDGVQGGSLYGYVSTQIEKERFVPGMDAAANETRLDDLLDACAADMSAKLRLAREEGGINEAPVAGLDVPFMIHCSVADLVYPQVIRNKNTGDYEVTTTSFNLHAENFEVYLDGVLIGTTGNGANKNVLKAKPGLHKLRLKRALFMDHQSIVKLQPQGNNEPMFLNITVEMSAEGLKELIAMGDIAKKMIEDRIVTEARVKAMEQYSKMLEERGCMPERRGPAGANPTPSQWRDVIIGRDDARPNANRP